MMMLILINKLNTYMETYWTMFPNVQRIYRVEIPSSKSLNASSIFQHF